MKLLIDMDNKSEIGPVEWEFIHDMQVIAPGSITPEMIRLTDDFMVKIPKQWKEIRIQLRKHVSHDRTIHCAIADIDNMGNEFTAKGTLENKNGEVLDFHKIVIYDEDKFEDDYIGTVITDKDGKFSLSFGKKTFSDFGIEAEPDIYFRVYYWKDGKFDVLGKITPKNVEKTITKEKKTIYDFGTVAL